MPTTNRGRWWALGALALAMLTIGLDTTILNVALPSVATDLHASSGQLQWFSTSYTLVLAALLIPAGSMGDRFGRKKLLVASLVLFGVASALCAFAGSPATLVAGRALLGIAAAFMMPLSMAMLPSLFPEPAERSRAMTLWVTSTALGLPLGPIVGGWLLNNFWWGSVFLINLPLVALGAVALMVFVPESRSVRARPVDLPGVVLSAAGLGAFTYGFIQAGASGWGSLSLWLPVLAGVLCLGVFLLHQRRTAHPLIDLALFRSRAFTGGTTLSTLANFAMFGLLFAMPQYFAAVENSDALGTGLRLLPLLAGMMAGTRLCGKAAARFGAPTVITGGYVLSAVALVLGATTGVGTGYVVTATWMALLGAGIGVVLPTSMNAALGVLTAERAGAGSGLLQALRQAGGTIGVAILGTLMTSGYRADVDTSRLSGDTAAAVRDSAAAGSEVAHRTQDTVLLGSVRAAFVHGMDHMLLACAALAVVGAFLAPLLLKGRTGRPAPEAAVQGVPEEAAV